MTGQCVHVIRILKMHMLSRRKLGMMPHEPLRISLSSMQALVMDWAYHLKVPGYQHTFLLPHTFAKVKL